MIKRLILLTLPVVGLLFAACGEGNWMEPGKDSAARADSIAKAAKDAQPSPSTQQPNIEVRTFEVIDTLGGKSKGWGYDLWVDGKRTIRQPIIPAVAGNDAFRTEADARKVGELAAAKMKQTGSLPTIQVSELDSLGIQYTK